VHLVAATLRAAGHSVTEADPPYPLWVGRAGLLRWFAGVTQEVDILERARRQLLYPATRRHVAVGRVANRFVQPEQVVRWQRLISEWFTSYDVLVTPVLAGPPIEARRWHLPWWRNVLTTIRFVPWPGAWNLARWPAASVPVGVHPSAATPLSAQLVAPPGGEALLLSVLSQIERARPWQRTAPSYA